MTVAKGKSSKKTVKSIYFLSLKQVREASVSYNMSPITSPGACHRFVQEFVQIEDASEEHFGFISLNTKNVPIGIHMISKGSINAAIVHPREVFKAAIVNNAASIICFHNHPSGVRLNRAVI